MNTENNNRNGNTTVTAFWSNDKFGEGAYLSAEITAESLSAINENLVEGTKLVLRPGVRKDGTPVVAKNGGQTFFLEILPPLSRNKSGGKKNTPRGRNTDDDI